MRTSIRIVFEFEHPEVNELIRWNTEGRYINTGDYIDANIFETIFINEEEYDKVKNHIWLVDKCHFKYTNEDKIHMRVNLIKANI